ncbi:MAG: HD domain-containing protein [Peptococcaceae bacterium]|nr:HD domain-containing protein [Peptococcaceae bacterium]
MRRDQLEALRAWFGRYVKSFYSRQNASQAGIKLKEDHTRRVCGNIVRTGRSLNLAEGDLLLAEAVALFHDIGRFRQYAVYGTFSDRRSENHALLGVRELDRHGVLSGLAEEERSLIVTAVRCHNMLCLPPGMEGRPLLFARLIRDADKLDILEVFTGHYGRPNPDLKLVLESGPPDTPGYSPVLVENLLRQKSCSYGEMKNSNDRKLLLLSWIYDINFPFTLSEIAGKGYVEKIIGSLPDTDDIREAGRRLRAYMARRLEPFPSKILSRAP